MTADLEASLQRLLASVFAAPNPGGAAAERSVSVSGLQRLSGGANMETWAFEAACGSLRRELILRRRPPGISGDDDSTQSIDIALEAQLLVLAGRHGVPVPSVLACTTRDETRAALPEKDLAALGDCVVMNRVRGEALPQRLLRDPAYAGARERLAFQCGEALGAIHAIALDELPGGLRDLPWQADLDRLQILCDRHGNVSPVHQLALNWLRDQPEPDSPRVLCHGDFRLGNLLVTERGLSSVLDWELAHIGHATEDLAYLCANVWRFGGKAPVGGFGEYRQLFDGYRSVRGWAPAPQEMHLWQVYAALGWGLVCLVMLDLHQTGRDPSLERAAVGRRLGESEIDLLLLLEDSGA